MFYRTYIPGVEYPMIPEVLKYTSSFSSLYFKNLSDNFICARTTKTFEYFLKCIDQTVYKKKIQPLTIYLFRILCVLGKFSS